MGSKRSCHNNLKNQVNHRGPHEGIVHIQVQNHVSPAQVKYAQIQIVELDQESSFL